MNVRWSDGALEDLERLYDFIALHNADAAQKAMHTIFEAVALLGNYPEAGRIRPSNRQFREFAVKFGARGYMVRYRIHDDVVIIVRVWHVHENS